jgi:alanyl-tRNA synthetase
VTTKLYLHDSYLTDFDAEVTGEKSLDNYVAVALDRTAFYPTSGGQQHDTGELNGIRVVGVVMEKDIIWHLLEKPLQEKKVHGSVNWNRRFDFMQQHTAFHILAAAFLHQKDIRTLSSHLGEESSTIDLDVVDLDDEILTAIETAANRIVWENRPVSAKWPKKVKLDDLPLRQGSERRDDIRLIDIQGYDLDPCGGTHVRHTGQVGLIKFTGRERIRGKLRFYFVAGSRALRHYQHSYRTLKSCSDLLTTGIDELENSIEKLFDENKRLTKELLWVQDQVLRQTEASLLQRAEGEDIVTARVGNLDLRKLCSRLVQAKPERLFIIVQPEKERVQFCFCSGRKDVDFHPVLELFKIELQAKGGGRPNFIQGSAPASEDIDFVLQRSVDLLRSQLT